MFRYSCICWVSPMFYNVISSWNCAVLLHGCTKYQGLSQAISQQNDICHLFGCLDLHITIL